MKTCIKKIRSRTTIGTVLLLAGMGIVWKERERQLQREIDEFDLIMRELKADRMRHYKYMNKNQAGERE